ncbi:unnamed protein product, partial [Rotaria sp. Silwood1]
MTWNNGRFSTNSTVSFTSNEIRILSLIFLPLLTIFERQDTAHENEVEDNVETGNHVEHTVLVKNYSEHEVK